MATASKKPISPRLSFSFLWEVLNLLHGRQRNFHKITISVCEIHNFLGSVISLNAL